MTISNDLIYEILRRVPVKHLLRWRCVSKTWCSLIDSPQFVKLHMKTSLQYCKNGGLIIISEPGKLYLADYESLHEDVTNPVEIVDPVIKSLVSDSDAQLVGSANGLLCFYTRNYDVILMNPSTRKCITLSNESYELRPTFYYYNGCRFSMYKGGFGYDHVSDDYKFVKFEMCNNILFAGIIVRVYSVRTNSWTLIQNAGLSRDIHLCNQWGMCVGGTLYWKAVDYGKKSEIFVGFDLGLGQFRVATDRYCENLDGFGGNLYTFDYKNFGVDVYQMNDYSAKNPWSKAFSIMKYNYVFKCCFRPLMYSESLGEVLILADYERLVWYHLDTHKVKKVRINQIRRICTPVPEFYTESLFQFPKDRQPQKQQRKKRGTTAKVANSKRKKQDEPAL